MRQRAGALHRLNHLAVDLTEVCHFLISKDGADRAVQFLQDLQSSDCVTHDLGIEAIPRIQALMHKYRDRPMDLADASLVLLAEDLDEGRILSTDENDFKTYRWKSTKPFKNLLLTSQPSPE